MRFSYSDIYCKSNVNRRFKTKEQQVKNKKEEARWELLVTKVVAAKAISSLPLPKRKLEQEQPPRSLVNKTLNQYVSVAC